MEEELTFCVDEMLGSLAKWLRLMGFDTKYSSHPSDDAELLACSKRENRVLLTRDTRIMKTRPVVRGEIGALLLSGNDVRSQLTQVLNLTPANAKLAPRCSVCNGPLDAVDASQVSRIVPGYVLKTQEEFSRCRECQRVYWKGTHWDEIQKVREQLTADDKTAGRNG